MRLLVDPGVDGTGVVDGGALLAEPEGDFQLCVLHRVGAVADVAANVDGKVTSDL